MPIPVLETDRLMLTLLPVEPEAAARSLAYFHTNRAHLEPWDPLRPSTFYTEAHQLGILARSLDEHRAGTSCKLWVLERGRPDGLILGTVHLSQIARGPFLSCMLGYGLDHRHVGRGLMSEGLRAVIAHAFGPLGLHRIQANHVPTNERSAATLRRLGFVVEGYAKDYLHIDGRWRDHVLTALLNPGVADPSPP